MKDKILISGGTGLVGQRLTQILLNKGFEVGILTRGKSRKEENVQYYHWDIKKGLLDQGSLENTSYIINLAGAGVADKKWTASRKEMILESRTRSTDLLFQQCKKHQIKLKAFISASAVGIYGNYSGTSLKDENSPVANDFLAQVVIDWEKSALQFQNNGIRTALLRIGIVLDANGGALQKIAQPIRYGIGAPLGSGLQYMSWVHHEDLANMFVWAMQNESISGPYNAVNPNPVTNTVFTKITAKTLRKPLFLPNVPAFALKAALGEMSSIVLGGINVSCQKIKAAGFNFKYDELSTALNDLLKK